MTRDTSAFIYVTAVSQQPKIEQELFYQPVSVCVGGCLSVLVYNCTTIVVSKVVNLKQTLRWDNCNM